MKHLLRGLDGQHAGLTYELGPRTIIGRAADADIQVLDPSVSRQHAKIVMRSDGSAALVDLGSVNGTSVDDVEVDRIRLRPGSIVSVLGTRFVFETVEQPAVDMDGTPVPVLSGRSLRRTAPRDGLNAAQKEMAGAETRVGPARSRPGDVVEVSHDDALTLVDEVLDYRELRIKQLSGEDLMPLEESRLERLRQKLHRRLDGREPSRRRFQRFSCELEAEIGRAHEAGVSTSPAPVTDLGAGGAQVRLLTDSLSLGEVVWLSVDVSDLYVSTPRVVFKTRVAWRENDGKRAGLVFAGQASYAKDAIKMMAAARSSPSWSASSLQHD